MKKTTGDKVRFYYLKCLNVGTVPTYKMQNTGAVPTFKMANIGTVPMFKMHNVGTKKNYDFCLELEIGFYGKNKLGLSCAKLKLN